MENCPQCNTPVEKGAHFCSHCGYSLTLVSPNKKTNDITQTGWNVIHIGSTLGERFLVLEQIARGGMGLVFKARDVILDEIVALKVLKADLAEDDEMIARFKREIKVARKIKHPNVCNIYDFGNVEDLFFISMEFIEGTDLSVMIKKALLPTDKYEVIVRGLSMALHAAHSENIIHRDLKPSNIKITKSFQPVIMDFGIARHVGKSDLTVREEVLGTPIYMAPEQFQGDDIDQRSDIYSLGVILYELYTGDVPFTGETPISIAMLHMQDDPVPPSQKNRSIPEKIEKIILKCLEKDPQDRFQDVSEIVDALDDKTKPPKEKVVDVIQTKILVADDDADIRKLITIVLEKNGYKVYHASNGEEAIAKAIETTPDLICLDLMMPKMDGYQAAEFLLNNPSTTRIPIIMITCKDDASYKAYGKSIGLSDYLTKPVELDTLVKRIENVLAKSKAS